MNRPTVMWIVAGVILVEIGALAGEFKPDQNTTFLAHYNQGLAADHSSGDGVVNGFAGLTSKNGGRWGEALIAKAGLCLNTEGVEGMYKHLAYQPDSNYDLRQGTLELWVKLLASPDEITNEPDTREYAKTVLVALSKWDQHGQHCRWAELQLDYNRHETPKWKVTILESKKDTDEFVDGKQWFDLHRKRFHLDHDILEWEKDAWHHIAFTWDAARNLRALFIDGKKIGAAPADEFRELVPQAKYLHVGGALSGSSEVARVPCLIDELRISNIVRYTADFTPEK